MAESRYPNVLEPRQQNGYNHKDCYCSGEIRDGHKLYREEDGHIHVEHPDGCEHHDPVPGTDVPLTSYPECPWIYGIEGGIREQYADGEDSPDINKRLPLYTSVEVCWEIRSGASWTDYGWEYDAEFVWWFPERPSIWRRLWNRVRQWL